MGLLYTLHYLSFKVLLHIGLWHHMYRWSLIILTACFPGLHALRTSDASALTVEQLEELSSLQAIKLAAAEARVSALEKEVESLKQRLRQRHSTETAEMVEANATLTSAWLPPRNGGKCSFQGDKKWIS